MKADRDDAPTHFRPSARRSNGSTWIVASFLGSILTVGMLYTLSALYMHDVADQILNGQKSKQAPIAEITRSAPAEKDWDKIVEEVARRSSETERTSQSTQIQQPKQTEYNAATYLPAHAVNVIPATRAHQVRETAKSADKVRVTIIEQSPSMKDRACWPHKEGSIERRNCRSAVGLSHRD
ncbi:hypothetical protein [Pseudomonas sp. PA27(2017)]|uniref:hypothetical protein n=1 Tax=Pseudomonas sp. PA27(2017) TaxID=1932112 RepID=UPI0011151F65|nr:hypothetical protein [Pseudomonas sp. PA27(2017)]